MKDFAAIDFETANQYRSSVCSVGVVIVRNGEVAEKFYSLIYPRPRPSENVTLRLIIVDRATIATSPEPI